MIDLIEIESKVNKVLSFSQEVNFGIRLNTEDLILKWFANKKRFIDLFGGELIYEIPQPVRFELGEKTKASRISDFCDWLDSQYNYGALVDFIYDMKDCFFSNIVDRDVKYYKENEEIIIHKGMKIIRSFKYFINNKEILTDIQNRASMIIQEDAVEGTLCLSVHPLDFLSSSENTYNWRSCHSLDGEFRAGNLSYMADNTTVICYLKGANNVILPDFPMSVPWNNKKWRMLLYFNEDNTVFFAGRQYPFKADSALDKIREIIMALIPQGEGAYSQWTDDKIESINGSMLSRTYINLFDNLYPIKKIVKDESIYHFNDLLESSCYTPYYMYRTTIPWYCVNNEVIPDIIPLSIGAKVKCICCGEKKVKSPSLLFCKECALEYSDMENDDIIVCDCCGKRMFIEDSQTLEMGESLCDECVENNTERCAHCGILTLKDMLIEHNHKKYCVFCERILKNGES